MFKKMKEMLVKGKNAVLGAVSMIGVGAASQAHAVDLIDYAATATAMQTSLGTAITAAIGVGTAVLIAKMGWRFFKSFTK